MTYINRQLMPEALSSIIDDLKTNRRAISDDQIIKALGVGKMPVAAKFCMLFGFREICRGLDSMDRANFRSNKLTPEQLASVEKEEMEREERDNEERRAHNEAISKAGEVVHAALAFYTKWKLSSGKSLGNATKDDLLTEANRAEQTANGLMRNADFYRKLADRLSNDQTVQEAIPLTTALLLKDECFKEAA